MHMLRALAVLAALPLIASAATPPQHLFPPFRIIGNLYYVGEDDLTSYLIVTPKGNILINTGFEFSAPEIQARIKMLGFRPSDLKILLVTHAHSDHAAGMATMKRTTGAKMWAIEQEAPLLESGGKTDFFFGINGWFNPVQIDHVFKDGDKIELGGTEITAHLTPGHTKGSTSYSLDVAENGRTYHVLIANLPNLNEGVPLLHNPNYPKIVQDYARAFDALKQLPCDVFLASHAGQFHMLQKYRPGMPYKTETFVDPDGYQWALQRSEIAFFRELDEQRQEEQATRDHLHFKDVIPQ